MKNLTNEKLLKLCISRNKEAWNEFVSRFKLLIISLVRKKLSLLRFPHTNEDIEEITSSTFGVLLEKDFSLLRKYNPEYSLSTWLGVIASTQVNRVVRKKRVSTVSMDEKDSEHTPISGSLKDNSAGPENVVEGRDLEEKIKKAIERLESREKLIITMLFFDELSYSDIALSLKMPENSVSKAIFRAKNALGKELKKEGISDFLP